MKQKISGTRGCANKEKLPLASVPHASSPGYEKPTKMEAAEKTSASRCRSHKIASTRKQTLIFCRDLSEPHDAMKLV